MNPTKKYYLLLIVGSAILIYAESLKPKPVDWTESYSFRSHLPFGNSAVYKLRRDLFPGHTIEPINVTF